LRTRTFLSNVDGKLPRRFERALADAIAQGLRPNLDAMPPRIYVDLVTMATFELGLRFKKAL
jgi:hypothetical protein